MSTWKQLVSSALVGTSQAKHPPLPAALQALNPTSVDTNNREAAFLAAAGAVSLWQRAGRNALTLKTDIPGATSEERDAICAQSTNHLRRMLRGDFVSFLPDWLRAVD